MIADRGRLKRYGLEGFAKDADNIENQYLNLIFDPNFGIVMERNVYERNSGLMEWQCAICGDRILSDRNRIDVENFVCEKCSKTHNSKNLIIDRRIMDSRTMMFRFLEDRIYEELLDNMKGRE